MDADDWETDPDYESTQTDPRRSVGGHQLRHQAKAAKQHSRTCVVSVCTGGACGQDGSRATLAEIEELASIIGDGSCTIEEYNCFGLCGRGPNVSIDWSDGKEEMTNRVRSTKQSIDILHKATGVRLAPDGELAAKLHALRRVSSWEQSLAKAQTIVDVLDVSSASHRSSAEGQRKYDSALELVDAVLSEASSWASTVGDEANHEVTRRRRAVGCLAEAVRRQVVAARSGRPVSPEVEEVYVDDPSSWPDPN